ncbi:hypothetical protein GPECTOR_54g251 [Gonium pectorale]|uniref:Peptidase C1A papain C-terminal domain-containing protein n=1 Tax=Gonium pectorale TaxID=33097 RepID=A0A150G6L6_GONPE|nr:hypothetical protein GPECTOR_54g251 [Gonium pectorale]|eukprot:KXZ45509.1 hypothetical protein GPECTOR_54g251 [Gonium pectorale]
MRSRLNWSCIFAALAGLLLLAVLGADAVSEKASAHLVSRSEPQPPVFPDVFHLKYTFSMPHFYLTQPKGLSYPVSVWYDGPNNRRRVEAYDGEDVQVSADGYDYTVIPRIDKLDCDVWGGPGRGVSSPLPYLDLWDYGGSISLDGRPADIWQRQIKEGDKVSQYTFYVSPEGAPLRLNMIGVNYLTNAHFDEYIYEFTHYQPSLPNNASNLFAVPSVCERNLARLKQQQEAEAEVEKSKDKGEGKVEAAEATSDAEGGAARQHPVAWQLGAVLPDIRAYDHHRAYSLWSRAHGRVHATADEYDARLERFRRVAERIQAHNARPDRSYSLRLNQWADWHEHEWRDAVLPNRRLGWPPKVPGAEGLTAEAGEDVLLSQLGGSYRPLGVLRASLSRSQLPSSVDWRGTGADPGIKDQGMCGSCYIVDCAWDYGPNGCFGGYYQPVFNYIAETGGIALEQEYTYRGEVGWCRVSNYSLVGRFSGYWAVESRNELALMEAVYKYGPVAVSVYADLDNFRYFSEGVYDEPDCSTRMRDLDHTVTLFGYGTTPDGKDYWLVRNSWAKYYGDDGYIKIVRGKHDCGIATDAAVPAVPKELVNPAAQDAARRAAARWDSQT